MVLENVKEMWTEVLHDILHCDLFDFSAFITVFRIEKLNSDKFQCSFSLSHNRMLMSIFFCFLDVSLGAQDW